MVFLQGKGIWTLYDDVDLAVDMAPQVGAEFILAKVTNRGRFSPQVAQTALSQIRRNGDLTPVAWTYMYLDDVEAEAECVFKAFEAGFEAFILDAESHTNLKFGPAERFTARLLSMGVDTSRIYLCTDPRLDSKINEIPMRQLAQVCRGGLIPMIYGEILPSDKPNAARRLFLNTYAVYERFKGELGYRDLALLPAFASYWDNQGHARMNYVELKKWCDECQTREAPFVSLYRAGVTASEAWRAFRELEVQIPVAVSVASMTGMVVLAEPEPVSTGTHSPVVGARPDRCLIAPDSPGYSEGFYPPNEPGGWAEMIDRSGNLTKYRATSPVQTMYASYGPALPASGKFVIEAFIPGTHATTRAANYFITHYENGERQQAHVVVDQQNYSDVWVPLGVFDLDPYFEDEGRVNLIDKTNDNNPREIAFSTIRWRPSPDIGGYDSPVGTPEERAGFAIWPGRWADANPYGSKYSLGYHTGADLNLNWPSWDLDRGAAVCAISDGIVTFAREVEGAWESLVVIRHDPLPDGTPVYARYGHVDNILVRAGEQVVRGQQIAQVGQGGGNYHLHFDISCTTVLENQPDHWPSFDLDSVKRHYVDPLEFIRAHRPR